MLYGNDGQLVVHDLLVEALGAVGAERVDWRQFDTWNEVSLNLSWLIGTCYNQNQLNLNLRKMA